MNVMIWNHIQKHYFIYASILVFTIGFAIRCIAIDSPLVDFSYNRQVFTASIARNFYHFGFNISYPEIDFAGDQPGYIEVEFQFYTLLVALLYKIFGIHEWLGRLVSVIFWSGSFWYLAALIKKFLGKNCSLFGLMFYCLSPLGIYYSRTFMPDSAMIFFSVGLIYYFSCWIENDRNTNLALATFFAALAFLVKVPTLYLGLPLLYLTWQKFGIRMFINKRLWLFLVLSLLPALLWYYHAHQIYLTYHNTMGIWSGSSGKWGSLSLWLDKSFYQAIFHRLWGIVMTPPGFLLFVLGLFLKTDKERGYLFHFWLVGLVIYTFILGEANMMQEHYQLPLVPVAAIFIGKSLALIGDYKAMKDSIFDSKIFKVFIAIIFFLLAILSFKELSPHYQVETPILEAARTVSRMSNKTDLLITYGDHDPAILYYAERKGWSIMDIKPEAIETLRQRGAKYLVLRPKTLLSTAKDLIDSVIPYCQIIEQEQDWAIFRLTDWPYIKATNPNYTYSNPPDYPGWTDSPTPSKLVDGYDQGGGQGSVAWTDFREGSEIIFDLRDQRLIHNISLRIYYHFPDYVFPKTDIYLSKEGQDYHLADSFPKHPFISQGSFILYSGKIDTRARYVKICLQPIEGAKVALTEVDIYRERPTPSNITSSIE